MFEVKGGKLTFKANDEKAAKTTGGVALKLEGERLAQLRGILKQSGWTNPASKSSSESTKSWREREALVEVALKLLDFAIDQHSTK